MVIAEKATGTIGRQVKELQCPSDHNDEYCHEQESDRGLRRDDTLWQLLRGPGAHGKLHQQHRQLL